MTDRELLELAAKAAGIGWQWFGATFCVDKDRELGTFHPWNPLTDDGDALRLLARLRLQLDYRPGFVGVCKVGPYLGQCPHDEENPNDTAATRRAIVRAAAEIGRTK